MVMITNQTKGRYFFEKVHVNVSCIETYLSMHDSEDGKLIRINFLYPTMRDFMKYISRDTVKLT